MTDYGHPIRFGLFVTPVADPVDGPVRLAVAADAAGLDLVTFQDHPYQSAFTETWTLLSFVAARTERVGLAPNVANLPLRPPAVLARAAASLDRLSGGRISLGLGAGSFWDPIAAMGGPRRTPGEAVAALTEAIDVLRQMWDAAARGGVRVDGEHYRVRGAKRGPAPVRDIPIWLGAYGPRMLRLTGRVADGWLPSLSYLKPGDLARGNGIIDDAARAAGRDPAEIVRLLNVGPDASVADLTELAVTEGVSTFVVATDDEATARRVAAEIAPAVREAVAAARARDGIAPIGRIRPARTLTRRRPGIDYDGLPASLAPDAVEPGDTGYTRYTSSYLRGGAPGLVLRADDPGRVADALGFAARHRELPLGILSAGHGISGRSLNDGGLVLDVSVLNAVEVLDPATGLVRVGPGARWADVAAALAPHDLVISSGDYGGVGVGGLATAGGIGYFARLHGLTIDYLRAVEVVLADGRHVRADAEHEPDLFWAMRGAGANFGVATAFEFEARPMGQIAFAQLVFDAGDTAAFLRRWGAAIEAADRRVSGEAILGRAQGGTRYARALLVVATDDADEAIRHLTPIAAVAPLVDQQVVLAGYAELLAAFTSEAPQGGRGDPTSRSGLAVHLTAEWSERAAELLDAGASNFFQIRSVGGAVADVPADATAYGFRAANFSIAALGGRPALLDEHWQHLMPLMDGMYLNFETSTGAEVLARAFPPAHLTRLRELKRRYDPSGLFRDNFFIDPS